MSIGKFHGVIRPTTPSGSCNVIANPSQPDLRIGGGGMGHDIAQCLLRDPIQTERGRRGRLRKVPFGSERNRNPLLPPDLRAMIGERGDQPGVLQDARMQVVRQAPNVVGESGRALLEYREVSLQIRITGLGDAPFQAAQRDR
jgi:hypothetical protein